MFQVCYTSTRNSGESFFFCLNAKLSDPVCVALRIMSLYCESENYKKSR